MLSTKTNYHHSILPKQGAVGILIRGWSPYGGYQYFDDFQRRDGKKKMIPDPVQVVAFPLCDNILPYSKGIHTAFFQNLRTGEIKRFSGFYFEERN